MPPLTLMIKPASGHCNMRCRYCFYEDEMNNRLEGRRGLMTEQTAEQLIRRAFTYADGHISFMFQGGEPTLAGLPFFKHFIQLVKHCNTRSLAIHYAIQTNGYRLDEEWIPFLRENDFLVGVSLDATAKTNDRYRIDAAGDGTFQAVQSTLKKLLAAGVSTNVLCVVTEQLAQQAEAVWQALSPYRYLQFIPCMDALDGEKQPWSLSNETYAHFLHTTYRLYKHAIRQGQYISVRTFDNWVSMARGMRPESCAMQGHCVCGFTVESNGDVYPCDFYALDEFCLGNVKDRSLFRMEKSAAAQAFIAPSLPVHEACGACKYYALCRNGCRRERVGGLYRFCEAHQAFFEKKMDDLVSLAAELTKGRRFIT